jgi:hypothetical protein
MFRKRARSAETGRFVTLLYALAHPFSTVVEAVRKRRAA